MDNNIFKKQNRTYLTEKRIEIRSWFNRHAPHLGELYEGALKIISEKNFPGHAIFIAHAVREIKNRLPDIILDIEYSYFDWKKELSELMSTWESAGPLINQFSEKENLHDNSGFENTIQIPSNIYNKIYQILYKFEKSNETYEEKIFHLFVKISNIKNTEQILRPTVLHLKKVTKYFEGIVHLGNTYKQINEEEFLKNFEYFENTLSILQGYFFRATKELDEILEETNS